MLTKTFYGKYNFICAQILIFNLLLEASNILLAKMATRKAKPNGQYHLTSDMVQDFIQTQSIKNIPGKWF